VAALCGLVAGAASATPDAARPPALLTYLASPRSSPDDQYRMCAARSDGTMRVQLVPGTLSGSAPVWSPDGGRLAFAGWNLDPGFRSSDDTDIVVADSRGQLVKNLTPNFGDVNYGPKWSPDGRSIAFLSDGLAVVPSDGQHAPTVVPLGEGFASAVSWFPNGKRLAVGIVLSDTMKLGIYSVNVDGSGLRFLVKGADPAISPDGSKLAYDRAVGRGWDIYVAKSDGTKAHPLAKTALPEQNPAWSPDGKWIAFERTIDPQSFNARSRIVVSRSNGKGAYVAISARSYDPFYPTWRRGTSLPKATRTSC
jgi:Tol biopolymer transport system component